MKFDAFHFDSPRRSCAIPYASLILRSLGRNLFINQRERKVFRFIILNLLLVCLPVSAADVTFGMLPSGAISNSKMTDVAAEICRDHLFDPSAVSRYLPPGYEFITAGEYGKQDPAIAAFVKDHPKYAQYAVGSLCLASVGAFLVDGVKAHPSGPTPMAFWWAHAKGPRDSRMQGESDWLQLASWYSDKITERARIVATDPMAQFVDIEVVQVSPLLWRLRLGLGDEVIEAEVHCSGDLIKRSAPEPGYMTVPFTGDSSAYFTVFTYFGHHHQQAEGAWKAKGKGVFCDALQIPEEAVAFKTHFQSGWSALSGLYKIDAPVDAKP